MATHSSTLAWKIPWMEGPGGLQSMGSLGVGYDWATSLSLFTFMHWRRKWQPTPVFLPGESQGRGSWWAAIYGVTQSRIRLKWLSSSSSMSHFSLAKSNHVTWFGAGGIGVGNHVYLCLWFFVPRATGCTCRLCVECYLLVLLHSINNELKTIMYSFHIKMY